MDHVIPRACYSTYSKYNMAIIISSVLSFAQCNNVRGDQDFFEYLHTRRIVAKIVRHKGRGSSWKSHKNVQPSTCTITFDETRKYRNFCIFIRLTLAVVLAAFRVAKKKMYTSQKIVNIKKWRREGKRVDQPFLPDTPDCMHTRSRAAAMTDDQLYLIIIIIAVHFVYDVRK